MAVIPKLKAGQRFCVPCGRVIGVGFADSGQHSASAAHIAAAEAHRIATAEKEFAAERARRARGAAPIVRLPEDR